MSAPTSREPGQQELFKAETQWFHIFKAMIDSGDLAKLPGSAVKVYMVIKAHTNFNTGHAFPSIEEISRKAGISVAQVKRELVTLGEHGYINKSKQGRSNVYTLREKVEITDEHGRPAAVATWDYLPGSVKHAVADLKNVLLTGDIAGAKVVHIEKLQVNVTHLHDQAVNFNVQQFMADLDKLPPHLRDRIMAGYEKSQRFKAGKSDKGADDVQDA